MDRVCAWCGGDMAGKLVRAKYCGQKCKQEVAIIRQREARIDAKNKKTQGRVCALCGASICNISANSLFCSRKCKLSDWSARNPGRLKILQKAWRDKNQERCRLQSKNWTENNRDKSRQACRDYHERNKAEMNLRSLRNLRKRSASHHMQDCIAAIQRITAIIEANEAKNEE